MKVLFLSLVLGSAAVAGAQEKEYFDIPLGLDTIRLQKEKLEGLQFKNRLLKKSWTLTGSTKDAKIYALPQDQMPCIVPDMDAYRSMPNPGLSLRLSAPIDPGILIRKKRLNGTVIPGNATGTGK